MRIGNKSKLNIVINKFKINSSELFVFIFSLWSIFDILQRCNLNEVLGNRYDGLLNISDWIIFSLLIIKIIFFQRYNNMKNIVIIFFISLVVVISTIINNYFPIMSLWLFLVAAKDADIDKCINRAYKIAIIMFSLVIIMFFLNIIPEHIMYRGNISRHTLGFNHPNTMGLSCFQLVLYQFYIRRKKLNIFDYFFAFSMAIFMYFVPNSLSSVVAILLLIICFGLYSVIKNEPKHLKIFVKTMMIIVIFMNVISVYYGIVGTTTNKYISLIDKNISTRLSDSHSTFLYYGIKWFGQRVYVADNSIYYLGRYLSGDNSYMILLIRNGIIIYLLFLIGYIMCITNFICHKKFELVIVFSVFAIYGIMENGMFRLTFNIFLLYMSQVLYEKTY